MKALSEIVRSAYTDTDNSAAHSLSLLLEYQIGGYFVPYEGLTELSEIYYCADYDAVRGNIRHLTVPQNIVAYLFWKQKAVLVRADFFAKLCQDCKGFGFTFYPVPAFEQEELCCSMEDVLPFPFSEITWIDDDFMDGDGSDFDFAAFYKIDAGVQYLNPKHFSVNQMMECLLTPEIRSRIRRTQGEYFKY